MALIGFSVRNANNMHCCKCDNECLYILKFCKGDMNLNLQKITFYINRDYKFTKET